MKVLIIYATKTGTVKKCAALLCAKFGAENADMLDISAGEPDLSAYDTLVLGTYVRMGRADRRITDFIKRHRPEIMLMRLGVYICGCFPDRAADAFRANFTMDIIEHAVCMDFFGGELDEGRLRGPDRVLMKMFRAAALCDSGFRPQSRLLPDSMANFTRELRADAGL